MSYTTCAAFGGPRASRKLWYNLFTQRCHGRGREFESRRPRHSFQTTCMDFDESQREVQKETSRRLLCTLFSARPELFSATHVMRRVELPWWRCFQRANIAFNLFSNRIFGNFQVITRLKIHPERRTVVEVARETQGCVSSNGAFLVDDIGDPRHRDAQVHSNSVHT